MPAGRPSLPVTVKKARGTYQSCRDKGLQTGWTSARLDPLDMPADLDERGRAVWSALSNAASWLTEADWLALELAAKLADLAALAEDRYRESQAPADARAALAMLDAFAAALARLGFDPAARSRLGLNEITAQTKLQKMMRR